MAENETNAKLKREFEFKAVRAYEQQSHRQSILVHSGHIYNTYDNPKSDFHIPFKSYSKHHASVLLLALKVCEYNERVLRLELPKIYREFSPFDFTVLNEEKDELRIAFISPRAGEYPLRCLNIGTFKNGEFTWLEYKGGEVTNIPLKIDFCDVDRDGTEEIILERSSFINAIVDANGRTVEMFNRYEPVNVKRLDEAGLKIVSIDIMAKATLKILDDKVVLMERP